MSHKKALFDFSMETVAASTGALSGAVVHPSIWGAYKEVKSVRITGIRGADMDTIYTGAEEVQIYNGIVYMGFAVVPDSEDPRDAAEAEYLSEEMAKEWWRIASRDKTLGGRICKGMTNPTQVTNAWIKPQGRLTAFAEFMLTVNPNR
jgi:hypothetical protein